MIEIICAVLGLVQGVLVALNKRSNWIAYILQMMLLFVFSLLNKLYGDAGISLIYVVFGVIGLIYWGKDNKREIENACAAERIIACALTFVFTLGLFFVLKGTDDPLPFLDAFTTVTSFVATYFMVTKKIDAWIVWFVNDIFYIVEYILLPDKAIYLAVLNLIWTALAVYSYFNWRKIMKTIDISLRSVSGTTLEM